jgi:hypothetical protein
MAVWTWLLIVAGAVLTVSILVGLAAARIVGQIAANVTDLLDFDEWSAAPPNRALEAGEDEHAAPARTGQSRRSA